MTLIFSPVYIRFTGYALCDLLQRSCEPPPQVLNRILCRHPVNPVKRAHATPSKVESLLKVAHLSFEVEFDLYCFTRL